MHNIESPQWSQRNRESSSRPRKFPEFPVFDDVEKTDNVIDVKSPIDLSKIDSRNIMGYLYEEKYIESLKENPKAQRVTLTSHVIDRFYFVYKGRVGLPDMLEFAITETQGGGLVYTLVAEAEVRSSEMDRISKLKRNGKFLRQADRNDLFIPLLRSVGLDPESVNIPKDRGEIKFTFVSPRLQEGNVLISGIPPFNLNYLQLPLPDISF